MGLATGIDVLTSDLFQKSGTKMIFYVRKRVRDYVCEEGRWLSKHCCPLPRHRALNEKVINFEGLFLHLIDT